MDHINDEYGRRTLDFVEDLQKIKDYDLICQRITAELEWFGYTHITLWSLPGPGVDINAGTLLNTRPSDYNQHYEQQNLMAKDPVVLALRKNITPFSWDDVRNQKITKAGRRIIDEAREFDARNGLVVPILTASGSLALFSPCGREPNMTARARSAVEMIGIYAHHALQRARVQGVREKSTIVPLTPREREVIKWVATGKSDDEIASILNIGRETVTTHVEAAKHKLDATRRTYAVVQALRFGEITL